MAERAGASLVYLDSLKDAALGLADDEVGARYNRARQTLLNRGIQLVELHHLVKRLPAVPTVGDVYGSAWLTAGAGSVILLNGQPGDPIVTFRHLKQPAQEIGPLVLSHDASTGTISVSSVTDPVALAKEAGDDGITARALAKVMFDSSTPSNAEVEKARRKLDRLTDEGSLNCICICIAGTTGGSAGGTATKWVVAWPPVHAAITCFAKPQLGRSRLFSIMKAFTYRSRAITGDHGRSRAITDILKPQVKRSRTVHGRRSQQPFTFPTAPLGAGERTKKERIGSEFRRPPGPAASHWAHCSPFRPSDPSGNQR
jgi:hypothetical protein